MRTQAELVALEHTSFRSNFEKLVEHCPGGAIRETDGVFAFVTGVPFSLFNGCIVTDRVASDELDGTLAWVEEQGVPYRAWILDELLGELGDAPLRRGLELQPDPYPGMVLHPVPPSPAPAAGVEIVPCEDVGPGEAVRVAIESGMPREFAELLYEGPFAHDPEVQTFVGRLDGRPVGTSTSIDGVGASGVVAVGTLPDARRRGVGTALSWAATDAGRRRGFDTVALQASAMGRPLYEAMGFRTVVTYAEFAPPRPR